MAVQLSSKTIALNSLREFLDKDNILFTSWSKNTNKETGVERITINGTIVEQTEYNGNVTNKSLIVDVLVAEEPTDLPQIADVTKPIFIDFKNLTTTPRAVVSTYNGNASAKVSYAFHAKNVEIVKGVTVKNEDIKPQIKL